VKEMGEFTCWQVGEIRLGTRAIKGNNAGTAIAKAAQSDGYHCVLEGRPAPGKTYLVYNVYHSDISGHRRASLAGAGKLVLGGYQGELREALDGELASHGEHERPKGEWKQDSGGACFVPKAEIKRRKEQPAPKTPDPPPTVRVPPIKVKVFVPFPDGEKAADGSRWEAKGSRFGDALTEFHSKSKSEMVVQLEALLAYLKHTTDELDGGTILVLRRR
jgi:hypothetical protein